MSLDKLKEERKLIKSSQTGFNSYLERSVESENILTSQARLNDFRHLLKQFNNVQDEIEVAIKEKDYAARNEFETKYYELLTQASTLLRITLYPRGFGGPNRVLLRYEHQRRIWIVIRATRETVP